MSIADDFEMAKFCAEMFDHSQLFFVDFAKGAKTGAVAEDKFDWRDNVAPRGYLDQLLVLENFCSLAVTLKPN